MSLSVHDTYVCGYTIQFDVFSCAGFSGEKEWDLFVSHSTVDKPWAREKVIVPLRNRSPPLKVCVCVCVHVRIRTYVYPAFACMHTYVRMYVSL